FFVMSSFLSTMKAIAALSGAHAAPRVLQPRYGTPSRRLAVPPSHVVLVPSRRGTALGSARPQGPFPHTPDRRFAQPQGCLHLRCSGQYALGQRAPWGAAAPSTPRLLLKAGKDLLHMRVRLFV